MGTAVFAQAIGILAQAFRQNQTLRMVATIGSLILGTVVGAYLALPQITHGATIPTFTAPAWILLFLIGVVLFSVAASYAHPSTLSVLGIKPIDLEIKSLEEDRERLEEKVRESKGEDIFENLSLTLNHLSEYYAINKNQARRSFQIGATSVILAFITIIAALIYSFSGDRTATFVPLIATAAGVLGQFIGGYCFILYHKSMQHVSLYYARLSRIQDTMLAVHLARDIEEQTAKTENVRAIIASLLTQPANRERRAKDSLA